MFLFNWHADLCADHGKSLLAFSIPIEVLSNGARRDLRGITSATQFNDFIDKVTDKMGTTARSLTHLGWIALYASKTPKPTPKLLEDEEDFAALLTNVWEYMEGCKAKNCGKGIVKPFSIILSDTSKKEMKEARRKKVRLTDYYISATSIECDW